MGDQPKPVDHISHAETFWMCGLLYKYVYIDGLRIPPPIVMRKGTDVHRVTALNLKRKMETGLLMPEEEVKDTASDVVKAAWDEVFDEFGEFQFTEVERQKGHGLVKAEYTDEVIGRCVFHGKTLAPHLEPSHVEREWTLEVENFPFDLAGTLDVQETISMPNGRTSGIIRDLKNKAKKPNDDEAARSLQLTAYHLAISKHDELDDLTVALDHLVWAKAPNIVTQHSERDMSDYRVLFRRLEAFAEAREKQVFNPTSQAFWKCSMMQCGFFAKHCEYVSRRK